MQPVLFRRGDRAPDRLRRPRVSARQLAWRGNVAIVTAIRADRASAIHSRATPV